MEKQYHLQVQSGGRISVTESSGDISIKINGAEIIPIDEKTAKEAKEQIKTLKDKAMYNPKTNRISRRIVKKDKDVL